jgi:nucleotide-binding universal stress UspA family protein
MVIAHATELSDDTAAFVHATALAAASAAHLVTVHGNPGAVRPEQLPDAGALARTWGRVVSHERRCHACCDDVTDTVVDAIRTLRPELVVLGTQARHGLARLFRDSVGEGIARNVEVPALMVPNRSRGFVDPVTGAIDLRRIVIPAGTAGEAARGIEAARGLLALVGLEPRSVHLEIIHVGREDPAIAELGEVVTRVEGSLEPTILATIRALEPCLVVMPTRGHDGLDDVLFGSHAEHIVRDAECPVLVVPM